MATINPHTTRATGTVLTATIYNTDHQNHITNVTAVNNDLIALSDVGGTTGIIAGNGSGTIFGRTITGTAGHIVVTNGNGVAGNPVLDLASYSGAPISTLVPGSTFGALVEGAAAGHLVLGIRDNDANDSVSIVSYNGTGGYARRIVRFKGQGATEFDADIVSSIDNVTSLGVFGQAWSDLYLGTGAILDFGAGSCFMQHSGSSVIFSGIWSHTAGTFNFETFSTTGATLGKRVFASGSSFILDSSVTSTTGGTVHERFWNPNGQVGSITTGGTATAYNTSSDERLKEFLGLYDPLEALAVIKADPTRRFVWKKDGSPAVGWGAQTSYAVSPDLATPGLGDPEDQDFVPWSVDMGKRTPYLWAVVPWLADQLEELKARIAALEG